jgi:hypothetical protein
MKTNFIFAFVLFSFILRAQSPLPITLTEFSAKESNDNCIEVTFETASESDVFELKVERSFDGEAWKEVFSKKSASKPSKYYFKDCSFFTEKIVYYRLKEISINGKVTIHKIISVELKEGEEIFFDLVGKSYTREKFKQGVFYFSKKLKIVKF